jgi:membrane protein
MKRSTSWLLAVSGLAALMALQSAKQGQLVQAGGGRAPADDSAEAGSHGRHARSPWQIPLAGWKDILWRTYHEVDEDRLLAVSGGVVFFVLLAIFPSITAFVSIYGLFSSPVHVADDLQPLLLVVPSDAAHFLIGEVQRIAAKSTPSLGLATGFSLVLALWSANAGTKSLLDALNVAYGEKEKRGFIRLNLTAFTFTIGMIVFLMLAAAAVIVVPVAVSYLGLGGLSESLWLLLRWPVLFLIVVGGLSILYRYGPSRTEAKWRWLTVGSLCATILWLVASLLFAWYLTNLADYNGTYGSLGAVIGLLTWLWLSVIAVLLGAELDAEIEHQTARDSTIGPEKPIGVRGAQMADTVGEAAP